MTRTIDEITRKFYEVIDNYSDDEHGDYWHLVTVTRKINGKNDYSWELKTEYKEEVQKELEKTVCSFADNSDDFAAAFAAFITCVIRYNLCDDNESYEDVLSEAADRLVTSELEDSEDLKKFLKDFSRKVCENDYDTIAGLCNDYDYSIALLYAFCYCVFLYSFKNSEDPEADEEIHEILTVLYDNMPDDMREYVFHKKIYAGMLHNPAVSNYLLPFIYRSSKDEEDMRAISAWWQLINDNLDDIRSQIYLQRINDKLNERLNNEISEDDNDIFYWDYNKPEINDSIVEKNGMLHIPVIIPNFDAFENELRKSIALEEARDEKNSILNDFSHRYKNMSSDVLYNVAQSLMNTESEELHQYGITLMQEREIKDQIKKEVDLLKLRFMDRTDDLKTLIRNSVKKNKKDVYSVINVLSNSIKKCMLTFFYSTNESVEMICDLCFEGRDFETVQKNYEQNILFEKNADVIGWFSNNIAPIDVSVSNLWKTIHFEHFGYADIVLTDLFVEMIMNVLKYADKTKPVYLDFTEDNNDLIIVSRNNVLHEKEEIPSTNNGIKMQNNLISHLNGKQEAIVYDEENEIFSIRITIDRKLF